jgi:hypothetical protein
MIHTSVGVSRTRGVVAIPTNCEVSRRANRQDDAAARRATRCGGLVRRRLSGFVFCQHVSVSVNMRRLLADTDRAIC